MSGTPIIIAGRTVGEYLMSIGLEGINNKEIVLHFTDQHADKGEYLLRILRKSFGWIEVERRKTVAYNTLCEFKTFEGNCIHPEIKFPSKCSEQIRRNCRGYKRKFKNPFTVNEVIIEQAGSITDL